MPVKFANKVPTKAIKRPMVAAKSSTTIAIRGPSVDSFNNFMIDFFSSRICGHFICFIYVVTTYGKNTQKAFGVIAEGGGIE